MGKLNSSEEGISREIEQEIFRAIKSIRYGSVEVIVHDSKVVQIERREKVRFEKSGSQDRR